MCRVLNSGSLYLKLEQATRLQRATHLSEVRDNRLSKRHVLKEDVGKREIEEVSSNIAKIRSAGFVQMDFR